MHSDAALKLAWRFSNKPDEEEDTTDHMSIFTKILVTKMVEKTIGKRNTEMFNTPLIRRGNLLEEIKHIKDYDRTYS